MFKGRHFDRSVILLCVRWYLAYNLSLRNLEEMMAERGISVDHATVHRWVIRYSPERRPETGAYSVAISGGEQLERNCRKPDSNSVRCTPLLTSGGT